MRFSNAVLLIILFSCQNLPMNKSNYRQIKEYGISERELIKAIKNLGKIEEPPGFWKDIINDNRYSEFQRNISAIELFKRHTYPGMYLLKFGEIVDQLEKFDKFHLSVIVALAGKIPIKIAGDRTVFHWQMTRSMNSAGCNIYFSLSGDLSVDLLLMYVDDPIKWKDNSSQLLEVGYFGDCVDKYDSLNQ